MNGYPKIDCIHIPSRKQLPNNTQKMYEVELLFTPKISAFKIKIICWQPLHVNPSDEWIWNLQDINQGKKQNQGTNVLENIFEANFCLLEKLQNRIQWKIF